MKTSAFIHSPFDKMTSAQRFARHILEQIEEDVYAEIARRLLSCSSTTARIKPFWPEAEPKWKEADALQALRELGYAPDWDHAEVVGAYPGYTLPDGTPGGDVLVFWFVDDCPEDMVVHVFDETGRCLDDDDHMTSWVRDRIWKQIGEMAYEAAGVPGEEERLQGHRSHADRVHDAQLKSVHGVVR